MRSAAEITSIAPGRSADLLDNVDYRLAETPEQKEEMYRLRYRAYLRDLEHPAGSNPGPRAERIEPEIYLHRLLICHNISSAALIYAEPVPARRQPSEPATHSAGAA